MSEPWRDAYTAWAGSDDYRLRLSVQHGFEAGWHARDEEVGQLQAALAARNLEGPTVTALQRQVGQLAARAAELLEEVVRERARAEAAEERARELEGVIWTAAYLERAHEVQKYIHKAWKNIEVLREDRAADPPTPTGEASGKMEARLKQAEEADRDFYRRQGKL